MDMVKQHMPAMILFVAIMGILFHGFDDASQTSTAEGERMLKESLQHAVVSCYALEGAYPENVEYIQKHYGVQIDESKYIVHYEIFAENILPEITVLAR